MVAEAKKKNFFFGQLPTRSWKLASAEFFQQKFFFYQHDRDVRATNGDVEHGHGRLCSWHDETTSSAQEEVTIDQPCTSQEAPTRVKNNAHGIQKHIGISGGNQTLCPRRRTRVPVATHVLLLP
jgi:hypothetical protein